MKRSFAQLSLVWGLVLFATSVVGCAGTGELRHLNLSLKQPAAPTTRVEPVKIVIEPFEDRRVNQTHVGARSHLGGGVTLFDVAGGKPVDVIAQALVNRLKSRGWNGRAWDVSIGRAGSAADADIVISGVVEEFSANAKSRAFSTVIDAKNRIRIQAKNLADGSTTTRNIENARNRTVFWFDEEDVRDLLSEILNDGIERLLADTKITAKSLKPVR
ncbi:MAG: YajG family lipoprotein [Nitrospira sp.]|nr:YajG family lipoprotein [Nitrospira sp.]